MGKATRNHKKKVAKQKKKANLSRPIDFSIYTIEELLKKAQEEINVFQYETAQNFCQEALKRDPDDVKSLEMSANLCLETNNLEGAKHCLGRAITVCPESGFAKYFSMAQLLEGKDALQCYLKGIELLNQCMLTNVSLDSNSTNEDQNGSPKKNIVSCNGTKDTDVKNNTISNGIKHTYVKNNTACSSSENDLEVHNSLLRKLSNAYCSIAELFMSDLCDEPEAESMCNSNIQNAIEADSTNPEAYQCHANFLLIKDNFEEAKSNIKKSVSLWLPKYLEIDDGVAAAGSFDSLDICPLSHASRISCARTLIEVEEHKLAAEVLEGLLGEDDEARLRGQVMLLAANLHKLVLTKPISNEAKKLLRTLLNVWLDSRRHYESRNDVYTWYLMGWNLYLQDDRKYESKNHLEKALEIDKKAPAKDLQVIDHIKELLKELKDVPEPPDVEDISLMEFS